MSVRKNTTPTNVDAKFKSRTVWGIAAGIRSTKDAARGAFTWRKYPSEQEIPQTDWLEIVKITNE